MKINIAQVIGLNTDQKAAQVISQSRNGDNSFFAVLDLSSDDAFTRGRQTLSELSDFYFDFEGSAAEKLNATFKEAQKKFTGVEFSLLLASVSGKILYLIGQGSVEVYLQRMDKMSPLLSAGTPSQLISGFLESRDRLLLATSSLTAFLGDDLTKSLKLPLQSFEEEITDRIGTSNLENQGLAALLVDSEEEEVEMPVLEEDQPSSYESAAPATKANLLLAAKSAATSVLQKVWAQKKYFPQSGRGRLIIAVVLIVVIALGVGFKVKAGKDARIEAEFSRALQEAQEAFATAKGLAILNPVEAKGKLDVAKDKVNLALSLKPDNTDAQNLQKQIETESGSILKQVEVSQFPLFLDMDLVKKNFRASQMSLSSGKLLVLDPVVKTLVVVDLAKKSNQILAGSETLGDAKTASLNGGLAFVYSEDKGIQRVDITNSKLAPVSGKDEDLGKILDIYGFAGNVYLLDSGNPPAGGMIWKYLPTSEGYSGAREYLNEETLADFGSAVRMQIESSIYVLNKDGGMLRFTRGDKDHFSYEGLDKGVKDPKSFFVSSETDDLYLLDSGNSRLLILTKTGSYKGQVTGDKFAQATDLVVDEKGKKVYLLEGSKIYQVDLQ